MKLYAVELEVIESGNIVAFYLGEEDPGVVVSELKIFVSDTQITVVRHFTDGDMVKDVYERSNIVHYTEFYETVSTEEVIEL